MIENILDKIMSLPPISHGPIKILELLKDGETDIADITNIIRYSPGMTFSVLKLANSPSYNHEGEIASIKEAVDLMGEGLMYKIIAASAFSSLMSKPLRGYDLTSDDQLTHSIAAAIIAEDICGYLKVDDKETIFTAALMHDIGKLILDAFFESGPPDIMKRARINGESLEVTERKTLGMDHGELGAMLLEAWEFPQRLVIPVRWHHAPEGSRGQQQTITDIIHIADNLSRTSGIGVGDEGLQYHLSKDALKRLKLKTKTIETILSKSVDRFNEILKMFNDI